MSGETKTSHLRLRDRVYGARLAAKVTLLDGICIAIIEAVGRGEPVSEEARRACLQAMDDTKREFEKILKDLPVEIED